SLKGLLKAVAAAFAMGAALDHKALFAHRFTRPIKIGRPPKFFNNPCELAPLPKDSMLQETKSQATSSEIHALLESPVIEPQPLLKYSPIETLRHLIARRTELPL